jgi:hypothetical protein
MHCNITDGQKTAQKLRWIDGHRQSISASTQSVGDHSLVPFMAEADLLALSL